MKPSQVQELLATIKATFVSFFSIVMFVALGVGVFLGISWSGPALETAADKAFDEGSFHNFQVQFPYGLTDDDIAKLSQVEGVTGVEAGRSSFQKAKVDYSNIVVKVQSVGSSIDVLMNLEGDMPAQPNEIVFEKNWAESNGFAIGDSFRFLHDSATNGGSASGSGAVDAASSAGSADASASAGSADASSGEAASASASSGEAASADGTSGDKEPDNGMTCLRSDTFTVVGLAESAEYACKTPEAYGFSNVGTGGIDAIAWVSPDAFKPSAFFDGYPTVNVRASGLDGLFTFGDPYKGASEQIANDITDLGSTLAKERYGDLHDRLQSAVDDGQAKLDDAKKKLADGQKEVADGQKKIDDGEKTIKDTEQKIADGEKELAEKLAFLEEKQAQFDAGKDEYDSKMEQLNEAQALYDLAAGSISIAEGVLDRLDANVSDERARLTQAIEERDAQVDQLERQLRNNRITQSEYSNTVAEADALVEEMRQEVYANIDELCREAVNEYKRATGNDLSQDIDHENFSSALAGARADLDGLWNEEIEFQGQKVTLAEARQMLEDGWAEANQRAAQIAEAEQMLSSGWAEYNNAVAQLEEGRQKVADGKAELEEAKKKLEDGKKKVADGQAVVDDKSRDLDSAKQRLANMSEYEWNVLPRDLNGGTQTAVTFSNVTGSLRFTMAALFVIVGLLVCYSAVSRLVHEQIVQIGTKKALGLRSREITLSFLLYSGLAVLSGAIIGTVVGVLVVEPIIGNALGARFIMGTYPPHFDPVLALVAVLVELVLVLLATWLACREILKRHAVDLLRGEKPPVGKTRFFEKWEFWDKLPLYTQTIVNNCLNDKRRVFGTVVGVAGCTALIVTAITLNNDVLASFDKQYESVLDYDAVTYFEPGSRAASGAVASVLQEAGCETTPALLETKQLKLGSGDRDVGHVVVPADAESFGAFYHIRPLGGGDGTLTDDGVWVSEALHAHKGVQPGDEIEVFDSQGAVHRLPVAGYFEYYLTYNEVLMSRGLYEREFAKTLAPNAVLVNTNGNTVSDLKESMASIDGFESIVDDKRENRRNFEDFSNVSRAVVLIYLALSALMAIVVLLNLNVMFIEEKKRDLITLMINGFSTKDAKRYIYNDTFVLTVIGIIVGVILGVVMGSLTVMSIEPETGTFFKGVDGISILAGVVGSALLAFIMSVIALRRIPKFSLTDINRM